MYSFLCLFLIFWITVQWNPRPRLYNHAMSQPITKEQDRFLISPSLYKIHFISRCSCCKCMAWLHFWLTGSSTRRGWGGLVGVGGGLWGMLVPSSLMLVRLCPSILVLLVAGIWSHVGSSINPEQVIPDFQFEDKLLAIGGCANMIPYRVYSRWRHKEDVENRVDQVNRPVNNKPIRINPQVNVQIELEQGSHHWDPRCERPSPIESSTSGQTLSPLRRSMRLNAIRKNWLVKFS